MKNYIDGIIVVEGKNDVSHLSSFIDADFVITNGYDLPKKEIEYLKEASKYKQIIILTDSDSAGITIREKLNETLGKTINCNVDIAKCNKHNKHGVAECEKEEIYRVLSSYFTENITKNKLNNVDIFDLKINKDLREKLCETLHLGICNSKTFVKRCNVLKINKNRLIETIKTYGN